MADAPSYSELATAVGISRSHAHEILNNDQRQPSRALAIRIYEATGWKPKPIANLTDSEIQTLAQLEAKAAA